jgi:3-dehydro-L-gulonate 2-dehydrogenase
MSNAGTERHEYQEIKVTLERILLRYGFSDSRAELCSRLFTETNLDGIYSHGLNRFPLFIEFIKKGIILPAGEPSLILAENNFERWDGNRGPGNLNAWFCMDRAIKLAGENGSGIVSLRNTNHWLRGGTYGLQAARQNCIGICMTNTKPNMPPWGGREARIGNNPFIISVPYEPYPVLLDMAMSQFSYGKMEILSQQGEKLPHNGGFNSRFELTDDPGQILRSELALPMGYWKGSGLAVLMDILVAVLSEGLTTAEIGKLEEETALSQLFIALDLDRFSTQQTAGRIIRTVLDSVTGCQPVQPGQEVFYPGKQTWLRRMENERSGIPVASDTWQRILKL